VEGKGANVDTGHVQGGHLGIELIYITPELEIAFNLPPESKGALARDVMPGSAAEKAGIRKGDLIVEFNGSQISTIPDLQRVVHATAPGMRVEVKIIREGRMKNLQAIPGNMSEAVQWYRKAAELGNASAQDRFGTMYIDGRGVKQDYKEAVKWFRKAAAQGYAEAYRHLGLMYARGEGVPQDYFEAVEWFRKAAEQGDVYAYVHLGEAYQSGDGVPQDYLEAVKWYRKAAEQGVAFAQNNLGTMYLNGWGVTRDYPVALEWFQKAAEQEYSWGYWNIARMYDNGWGVRKDGSKAEYYYRKAARNGHNEAQKALKERGLDWAEDGQEPAVSREEKEQPPDDIDVSDDLGEL
jgi:hypothetical protein